MCDFARLLATETHLQKWLDRKESYWKQLSRDKWMESGDKNTKYFHAIALGRRRFKRIDQIKSGNRMVRRPRDVKIEVLRFFKELYRQKTVPRIHIENSILPRVNNDQVQMLQLRPTLEEINLSLKDCDASKVPGYDGFNFKFVKEMWYDIGHEICDLIFEFFDSGILPKEINQTWVALIPKLDGAVEIKDFRPISMIGSIYKIISKILAR